MVRNIEWKKNGLECKRLSQSFHHIFQDKPTALSFELSIIFNLSTSMQKASQKQKKTGIAY